MKFKDPIVLFRTVVGSHMWGQHHSKSDKDMFECYIFDSRSFLLGNRHDGCHNNEGDNEETISCEIGHVIRQLLKGNVNFLWGVMSPKVEMAHRTAEPSMWDLRKIVRNNLSKSTAHSIRGFAIHNLKHWFGIKVDKKPPCELCDTVQYYVKDRKPARLNETLSKYKKILNTCARTLDFGIKLLKKGELDFENPRGARTTDNILYLLTELELAYKESKLPDKPDPKPFEDFLLAIREENFDFERL